MGGSSTLVDGVRRWFQRRHFIASSSSSSSNNNNNENIILDRHDHTDSAVILSQKEEQQQQQQHIIKDFDFSSLKPINVPKRNYFLISTMDSHKKVFFFLFFIRSDFIASSFFFYYYSICKKKKSFNFSKLGRHSSFTEFPWLKAVFFVVVEKVRFLLMKTDQVLFFPYN